MCVCIIFVLDLSTAYYTNVCVLENYTVQSKDYLKHHVHSYCVHFDINDILILTLWMWIPNPSHTQRWDSGLELEM